MFKTLKIFLPSALLIFLYSCVNTKKLDVAWVYKKQIIYEGISDSSGKSIVLKDSLIQPCVVKITRGDSIIALTFFDGRYTRDTLSKVIPLTVFTGLYTTYLT